MTAKDCLYNIPDETRFVNIFFRANGIKWREIFGRQRYSENVRQVPAPAVELQRPTRPLIRLLNRNKPFPTELFIIGSRQCKQSVGRDALIPPWRNLNNRPQLKKRFLFPQFFPHLLKISNPSGLPHAHPAQMHPIKSV